MNNCENCYECLLVTNQHMAHIKKQKEEGFVALLVMLAIISLWIFCKVKFK